MVKKAFAKTVMRSFLNNIARFISITFIIMLSIAFVSGLGTIESTFSESFSNAVTAKGISDILVKSTSQSGFNADELIEIESVSGVEGLTAFTAMDLNELDGNNGRVYFMDFSAQDFINQPVLLDGKMPESMTEIAIERATDFSADISIGDTVSIQGLDCTVVGIVNNPLMFMREGDNDIINDKPLEVICYVDSSLFPMAALLPKTDAYIRVSGVDGMNVISKKYQNKVDSVARSIEGLSDNFTALTLEQNKSTAALASYLEKVSVICSIFPVFFIAVSALTVLTTMARLVEEERSAIGCYKSLGYGDDNIVFKYFLYSLFCCAIACTAGLMLGTHLLPPIIYPAFNVLFFCPTFTGTLNYTMGLIAIVGMITAICAVTIFVAYRETKAKPADILRPKAPKAGKKIFLERIKFVWNNLSFKYKSSYRNIFRYVNHLVMTVISVAGSTALVFAGFALLDISDMGNGSFEIISAVVMVFALLLSVFVIYNLTNMNIGERQREIATLKVLGYHDGEVAAYIYREILIMAIIGIVFGIPLGYGLIGFIFYYLDFSTLSSVNWYSPLLSALLVLVFVAIVDLLLLRKIRAIDMTSSLKSIE